MNGGTPDIIFMRTKANKESARSIDSQEKILNIIISYINEHQYPPTVRDILERSDYKSVSTVHGYMRKLFEKGFLETDIDDWNSNSSGCRAYRVKGYKLIRCEEAAGEAG